jgi:hypothetical protein
LATYGVRLEDALDTITATREGIDVVGHPRGPGRAARPNSRR